MNKFFLFFLLVFGVAASARDKPLHEHFNIAVKGDTGGRERPFVIVIPSYNNFAYVSMNLNSVLSQEYGNYRVIYIDDASTDETFNCAKAIVSGWRASSRVTLQRNRENRGALYNIYTAVQGCAPEEIVVILDGDDWLKHPRVLQELNCYYANENTWMTYGQYEQLSDGERGCSAPVRNRVLKKQKVRKHSWCFSHLRTFYAGLFHHIRLDDLLFEGHFFNVAADLAVMFPMLEMAGVHARFIPDVLYVYNDRNPISDRALRQVEQSKANEYIRSRPRYSFLYEHPAERESSVDAVASYLKRVGERRLENRDCDLILFSYDRPMQLYALLESLEKHVTGFHEIFVIYRSHDWADAGYQRVQEAFPKVSYLKQSTESKEAYREFQAWVLETTFGRESSYIAYGVDDNLVIDEFDVEHALSMMERTGAYAFSLRLAPHIDYCYMTDRLQGVPPLFPCDKEGFVWQFSSGMGDWNYPHSVDFTIYRKEDIEKDLRSFYFHNPNVMEDGWAKRAEMNRLGLCYERSKVLNIPINVVTTYQNRNMAAYSPQELCALFDQGYRLFIDPFYQLENRSCHVELTPEFVR